MFETSVCFFPVFDETKAYRVMHKVVASMEDDAVAEECVQDGADDDWQNQDGDFEDDMEPGDEVADSCTFEREERREKLVLPGMKKSPLALIN